MTQPDRSDSGPTGREWTITGWHEGSPGTGGVYVEGPGLEPGESVTVVEFDREFEELRGAIEACRREDAA